MAAFGLYNLLLFFVALIAYGISIFILVRTYRRTKFISHLLLAVSFCSFFISSLIRFVVSFITDLQIAQLSWSFMNTFSILGILLIFYAFMIIRFNKIPVIANLVSFFSGMLIVVLADDNYRTLTYNEQQSVWTSQYTFIVPILMLPMLIFFIISFILPLAAKFAKDTKGKVKGQFLSQIFGFSVVIIWAVLAGFTGVPALSFMRPFMLPLGWMIWSITLFFDPFNIMFSNAKIKQIILTNKTGLPFYTYSTKSDQQNQQQDEEYSSILESGLISGITSALERMAGRTSKLTSIAYQDEVIGLTKVDDLNAFVIGERFDKTLETMLNFLLYEIQQHLILKENITADFINLDEYINDVLKEMIERELRRVLII